MSLVKSQEKKGLNLVRKNLSSIHGDISDFISKISNGSAKHSISNENEEYTMDINDHDAIKSMVQLLHDSSELLGGESTSHILHRDVRILCQHLRPLSAALPNIILPNMDAVHFGIKMYANKLQPEILDIESDCSMILNQSIEDVFSVECDNAFDTEESTFSLSHSDSYDLLNDISCDLSNSRKVSERSFSSQGSYDLSPQAKNAHSSDDDGSLGFTEVIQYAEERSKIEEAEKISRISTADSLRKNSVSSSSGKKATNDITSNQEIADSKNESNVNIRKCGIEDIIVLSDTSDSDLPTSIERSEACQGGSPVIQVLLQSDTKDADTNDMAPNCFLTEIFTEKNKKDTAPTSDSLSGENNKNLEEAVNTEPLITEMTSTVITNCFLSQPSIDKYEALKKECSQPKTVVHKPDSLNGMDYFETMQKTELEITESVDTVNKDEKNLIEENSFSLPPVSDKIEEVQETGELVGAGTNTFLTQSCVETVECDVVDENSLLPSPTTDETILVAGNNDVNHRREQKTKPQINTGKSVTNINEIEIIQQNLSLPVFFRDKSISFGNENSEKLQKTESERTREKATDRDKIVEKSSQLPPVLRQRVPPSDIDSDHSEKEQNSEPETIDVESGGAITNYSSTQSTKKDANELFKKDSIVQPSIDNLSLCYSKEDHDDLPNTNSISTEKTQSGVQTKNHSFYAEDVARKSVDDFNKKRNIFEFSIGNKGNQRSINETPSVPSSYNTYISPIPFHSNKSHTPVFKKYLPLSPSTNISTKTLRNLSVLPCSPRSEDSALISPTIQGISTPTPFSSSTKSSFKPIGLKTKQTKDRTSARTNTITVTDVTKPVNKQLKNNSEQITEPKYFEPLRQEKTVEEEDVERPYTDDDIDVEDEVLKTPEVQSSFYLSPISLKPVDSYASASSHVSFGVASQGNNDDEDDFVSPPLPPPPSAEDLRNATSSGRTSVTSSTSTNDEVHVISPTYKASAETAVWSPNKSVSPVEVKQTPLYAVNTQKPNVQQTYAKSWTQAGEKKAFKSVSRPVFKKTGDEQKTNSSTTTTTYSLPTGQNVPANVQVTPQHELPDGAVYETKTIEDNKIHTDTYYAVPGGEKTVYERMKTTKVILSPHYQGMGPTDEKGIPVALRSSVDDQKQWYKNMFKQIHNQESRESSGSKAPPRNTDATSYYGITESPEKAKPTTTTNNVSNQNKFKKVGKITDYKPATPYVVENKPEEFSPIPKKSVDFVNNNTPKPLAKSFLDLEYRLANNGPIPQASTSYHAPKKVDHADLDEEESKLKEASKLDDLHMPKFFRKPPPVAKTEPPVHEKKTKHQETAHKQSTMGRKQGVVKYNFTPQTAKELALHKGQTVVIIDVVDDNWYTGETSDGKYSGIFPINYVELLETKRPRKQGLARAKFNFTAQINTQLTFEKGQEIILTDKVDNNWFKGTIGSASGLLPANYVEVITMPEEKQESKKPVQKKPASVKTAAVTHNPPPVKSPVAFQSETDDPDEKLRMNKASYLAHSIVDSKPRLQSAKDHQRNKSDFDMTEIDEIVAGIEPVEDKTPQTNNHNGQMEPSSEWSSRAEPHVALYAYQPTNEDELELKPGDIVMVLEKCDDGWFVGTNNRNGAFGTFPGNYVALQNN